MSLSIWHVLAASCSLAACATAPTPENASGFQTVQLDPGTRGVVAGVGIESQDIVSMTDQMMRDMLSSPTLAGRQTPPRVIIDSQYFKNESSQRINKNAITDRLRVGLNRAAAGRMTFIGRQNSAMVEEERALKREGMVDTGTVGLARAPAGADYRLAGNIVSVDAARQSSGVIERYNQISFEMIDLETGEIVWSNLYEFKRAAADDVIYR